ncbi:MAG TPA: polysaccharide deacetylase family protein [Candidatus Acidoferrum sp.]|nr:polysaccharide deacetylase family protein [Candidatus Acidoferrum sp.]
MGSHAYCSEACAVLSLADEASRTSWILTTLELRKGPRDLRHPARLRLARWHARLAQGRLDRRLDAGPHGQCLPWLWLPPRSVAAGLVLALAAWGVTGGPVAETRRLVPVSAANGLSVVRPVPAPAPIPPQVATPAAPSPLPATAPPHAPAARVMPQAPPVPLRPRPVSRVAGDDLTRGNTSRREVAFTFDGGDEANVTDEILGSLRARGIRATMFLTGQFIRQFPDVVRRMAADGHEIGNHLDTHPHLTTYAQDRRQQTLPNVTREFLLGQLRRTEASFRALTGLSMAPYWRAPFGEHNVEIRGWAAEAGYRHISWTRGAGTAEDLDTRDWVADRSSRIYRSREEIAARILEFGRGQSEGLNGGVILMHLATHRRTDRPHESLPEIMRTLQDAGYRLVTISELVDHLEPRQARLVPPAQAVAAAPAAIR